MKMNTKMILALTAAAALATTSAVAKPGGGTDILHFSIHTALTDTGVEPGSAGTVSANEVRQGAADNQKLDVTVSGLTASNSYSLTATTGSGTVDLEDFQTDNKGKATLHLSSGGKGGGKNTTPLPDGFELAQVTELDVTSGAGTVLSTGSNQPTAFQYLVKRNLSTNGVTGVLQIKANQKSSKFTLTASGLDASTDYTLYFNGAQVQTNTSDSKGRLKITSAPTPANIMDLNTVELRDAAGSTVILSTTLP